MALHGSQSGLLINGFNMATYFRDFSIEGNQTMHDATVLGNSSPVKVPGLKDGKASGTGFHDATATVGSYPVLKGLLTGASPASANPAAISRCLNSTTFAVGSLVDMIYCAEASLQNQIVIDNLVKLIFSGDAESDAMDFGVSLHALAAETSFPVTGTSVDNTAATTNGGVATLHVTAIAGGAPSLIYKIQHSSNGSSWADLVTFSAVTTANSLLRNEVAAGITVNRYLRETTTENGTTTSVTGVPIFARR